MKWLRENKWYIQTAIQREASLGTANAPKKERKEIYTLSAPAMVGRNYLVENGITLEASFHYNGSAGSAFGGAEKWPCVIARIPFQEGEIEKRNAFVSKLQTWLEQQPEFKE